MLIFPIAQFLQIHTPDQFVSKQFIGSYTCYVAYSSPEPFSIANTSKGQSVYMSCVNANVQSRTVWRWYSCVFTFKTFSKWFARLLS
jgi:hypothetical protein